MKIWRSADQPRRNKYGARRVPHDDHWHDSQGERERCFVLQQKQRAEEIAHLRIHPRYVINVGGVHICDYFPDWDYEALVRPGDGLKFLSWQLVVEDFKSPATRTAEYKLKVKLMLGVYGLEVRESMLRINHVE